MTPEQRVAGRYVVEAPLGKGGMGEVLRARDLRLDRSVALKVLPQAMLGDGYARARLLREARAAAALDHPNIVHVYDVGEADEGAAYIAMELVRGRTLRAMLSDGPVETSLVARITGEVASALTAAHRAGFVHRDVKPDNVMVRDDGRAVVLDFGLAKPVERDAMLLTADGSIVGTPAYLSPEQSRGEPLTGASDQFALAVTAFELLTGRLPWVGQTAMAVLAAIVADAPLGASSLRPALPTAVDGVFERALSKTGADRYPDCVTFADALALSLRAGSSELGLLETAHASATPVPRVTTPTADPAARSSRRAVWLVGTLTVLVVGGVAWTFSGGAPTADSTPPLGALGREDVIACPILEIEGAGSEEGWLGAAVGSAICDRAVWMLDGRTERTRSPADLLELPTTPGDGAAPDVFVAPDARERTERAAARTASAVVRGTLRRSGGTLEARLELERAGRRVGHVEARGTVREIAVAATDAWREAGVLPAQAMLDDEVARWTLVSDPRAALALHDLRASERAMDDTTEACRVLTDPDRAVDPLVLATTGCPGHEAVVRHAGMSPPQLAVAAHLAEPLDPSAIAAIERARAEETSELGRGRLATAHALALASSDSERALEIMLVAAPLRRRDGAELWMNLSFWANRTTMGPTISQAYSEWAPADPDAWATRALVAPLGGRLELLRRAHAVAPHNTSAAADLAFASLAAGSTVGARAVAAELADGGDDLRFVAEMISIVATSAEGRISAARERALALIESIEHPVTYRRQDYYLVDWVVELAVMTGDRTLADAYLRRVLAEPELGRWSDHTLAHDQWVAMLAAVGSPALGREVIALLHTQRPSVLAVRALLAGDRAEASRHFRQILVVEHFAALPFLAAVGSPVLESEGSPEVAARVDDLLIQEHGLFHGVGSAHIRAARRLARSGDGPGAAAMATRVVDALASSDMDLPVLAEMRAIAAGRGP